MLSVLQLFHVGYVLYSRQSVLFASLARRRMTDLLLWARIVVRTSDMKISCSHLADCKKIAPKSMLHVLHDHFSSFNQLNHRFLVLFLLFPLLSLKLFNNLG